MSRSFTSEQEKKFAQTVTPETPAVSVEDSVQWVSDNLSPETVFEEKDLQAWAIDNGYIKEPDWTAVDPADYFDAEQLMAALLKLKPHEVQSS